MAQTDPKTTQIAINGNAGLMTNIALTILASKVTVIEDPSVNNGVQQGLQGYYIDNQPPQPSIPIVLGGAAPPQASPAGLQVWLPNSQGQSDPAHEPIVLGGTDGRVHGGEGNYVGAQGTVVLQLRSNSPTPSQVLLVEYP